MGYNTHYSFSMLPAEAEEREDIQAAIPEEMRDQLEYNEYSGETGWYDHDEHVLELSEKFPDVIFLLDGQGEAHDDIWAKAYFRGHMRQQEVVMPAVKVKDWMAIAGIHA